MEGGGQRCGDGGDGGGDGGCGGSGGGSGGAGGSGGPGGSGGCQSRLAERVSHMPCCWQAKKALFVGVQLVVHQ